MKAELEIENNDKMSLMNNHQKFYGIWLYTTTYHQDKTQPPIGHEGNSQSHNHDNTSTESNVPIHIDAYFNIRVD